MDAARHRVTVAGREVDLSPTEFALLLVLVRHAGRVLTHRAILEEVWGPDAVRETQHLRVSPVCCARSWKTTPPTPGWSPSPASASAAGPRR